MIAHACFLSGGGDTSEIYLFFTIILCFRDDILEMYKKFLSIDALLNGKKTSCAYNSDHGS